MAKPISHVKGGPPIGFASSPEEAKTMVVQLLGHEDKQILRKYRLKIRIEPMIDWFRVTVGRAE